LRCEALAAQRSSDRVLDRARKFGVRFLVEPALLRVLSKHLADLSLVDLATRYGGLLSASPHLPEAACP